MMRARLGTLAVLLVTGLAGNAGALSVYVGNDISSGCLDGSSMGLCGGESGAQCNNAIDDDGDGVVNGGCGNKGTGSPTFCAPSSETECEDALDNDRESGPCVGDGFVNDGCSAYSTIKRVDSTTNAIAGSIPLGLTGSDAEDFRPVAAASAPDGKRVYVVGSENLAIVDTATNAVVTTVPVGGGGLAARSIGLTEDGCFAFVTTSGFVDVIDIAAATRIGEVDLSSVTTSVSVDKVVVSPVGQRAYLGMSFDDAIVTIDTATFDVVGAPLVFDSATNFRPEYLAINPTGTRLYAGDARSGRVAVINTATNTLVTLPDTGSAPIGGLGALAVHPDGDRVYVGNGGTVHIIVTATNTVSPTTIDLSNATDMFGMAFTPDGSHLYVVAGRNSAPPAVFVIDTATDTVVDQIAETGFFPAGLTIAPPVSNLPACVSTVSTTSTTTTPPTTTPGGSTTSTTLSGGSSCATARDCVRELQTKQLCTETLPPGLENFIGKSLSAALTALDKAAAATKEAKTAKFVRKGRKKIQKIDTKADKFTRKKKTPISGECRTSIGNALAPSLARIDANLI